MSEFLTVLLVIALGVLATRGFVQRLSQRERALTWVSLLAHVSASGAQVYIETQMYGESDMSGYFRGGSLLARVLEVDFWVYAAEVTKLILRQEAQLPVSITLAGTSSGSMVGLTAFFVYGLGSSFWVLCTAIAVAAHLAKLGIYLVVRARLPSALHGRAQLAIMLVPSVVFWSSGLLKESVAMIGIGCAITGSYEAYKGRRLPGVLLGGTGIFLIVTVKAYLIFPLVVGAALWRYWIGVVQRAQFTQPRLRLSTLFVGVAMALASVLALGKLLPDYSIDSFADQAADYQEIGGHVTGGSSYVLGDPSQRSLAGQLAFAPLALLTSLFRPALFEVRNVQMLANSLETTLLSVLFLSVLFRRSRPSGLSVLTRSPELIFCCVFVLIMALAVGLTTTNLGTLSRYRMPMVPFFALLMLVMTARARNALIVSGPSASIDKGSNYPPIRLGRPVRR